MLFLSVPAPGDVQISTQGTRINSGALMENVKILSGMHTSQDLDENLPFIYLAVSYR